MTTRPRRIALSFAAFTLLAPVFVQAQTAAPAGSAQTTAAPRQSGTVKAVTSTDLVLTTVSGQDVAVNVPSAARILLVDPATHDVKGAHPGTFADVKAGDKAIVTGTTGDSGQTLTATRILLLKSGAIEALHAQQQAAWAHSIGGIVKTTDTDKGALSVVNGTHTYTIQTSPSTIVRRYTGASVRFEDAVKSTVSAIRPGDQVQARGQRSPDGTTVTADEIVAGSFSNYSGLLTAVDSSAGTVTLKDLATKKTVTVAVTAQTNLRKLPADFSAGSGAGSTGNESAGERPAQAPEHAGSTAGQGRRPGAGRMDLSRIVNRLPTETTADLKQGDAVMIVASNSPDAERPTAITLLSGVEKILASSPAGGTTLSPWSLGGGEAEAGGESAGSGGR